MNERIVLSHTDRMNDYFFFIDRHMHKERANLPFFIDLSMELWHLKFR